MPLGIISSQLAIRLVFLVAVCLGEILPFGNGIRQERSTCGGDIAADSGIITSPNFPRPYSGNRRCNWVISVPEDNTVKLTFESFRLEVESRSEGACIYDYVTIYDGPTTSSSILGTYCGVEFPDPVESSSNTMTIVFRSDDSVVEEGFKARFAKVPTGTITECLNPQSASSMKWVYYQHYCYSVYTGSSLTFVDAKALCRGNGAHLASIHSTGERNFIRRLVREKQSQFWIGLRKQYPLDYEWEDGTPVDYLNWSPGLDDDDDEDSVEDASGDHSVDSVCAAFQAPGDAWMRKFCDNRYHLVCKYRNDSSVSVTETTTTLTGFCPDMWEQFGTKCYRVFGSSNDAKNWHGANEHCASMGGSLVSIHSRQEQDYLTTMTVLLSSRVYIGLSRSSTGRAFSWSDNSPLDFSYWNKGEPNNYHGSQENCVEMRKSYETDPGKWNDIPCQQRTAYICQLFTNPDVTIPGVNPNECTEPVGWLRISSSCYKVFHANDTRSSWSDAKSSCETHQANLATMKNFRTTVSLRAHLEDLDGYFWIGIKMAEDHRYAWVGSAPLIYTNWRNDQPKDVSDDSNCVAIDTEGKWMVKNCNESLPFICEVSEAGVVPTLPPHPYNVTCPPNSREWHDFGGRYCYLLEIKRRVKWYEAACECTKKGGNLASFHSINEMDVMMHHVKDFDMFVHIGMERNKDDRFVWTDGSPVDFDNWGQGESSDPAQKCAAMYTDSGKWSDIYCTEEHGYICSTLKVPEAVPSTPVTLSLEGEENLSPGFISLIVICVLVVLVAIAVALRQYFLPAKTNSMDSVPFVRTDSISFTRME